MNNEQNSLIPNNVYYIEQFWRRLKNDLQIHRMRLRGREGVYGMVAIKLLAYLVMEKISALAGTTFHQIKNYAKRHIDLWSFFTEHFHFSALPKHLWQLHTMEEQEMSV